MAGVQARQLPPAGQGGGSVYGQLDRTLARLEAGGIVIDGTVVKPENIKLPADFQQRLGWWS